jgi:hypothetical protein
MAPDWELDELHRDMKWDLGFGLRAWVKGLVVNENLGLERVMGIEPTCNLQWLRTSRSPRAIHV